MLTVYVVCLIAGGGFVAASTLLGHHDSDVEMDADVGTDLDLHVDVGIDGGFDADLDADLDADFDGDLDVDMDADFDGDHDAGALVPVHHDQDLMLHAASDLWLPFVSLRFWTFFSAFFGLTGTVLTALWASQTAIFTAALGTGGALGYGAAAIIQRLRRQVVDSSVKVRDYIGSEGKALLPLEPGELGKVRITIRGQLIDMTARTEDPKPIDIGQPILVYGIDGDVLRVTNHRRQRDFKGKS